MGFSGEVREAAGTIRDAGTVSVISHIDADGISSEAILRTAIARAGIPVSSRFVRQLEPLTMTAVPDDDSLKVFVDLGAGQQNLLEERGLGEDEVLILDHHVAQPCGVEYHQVNGVPHGHTRLSAAGVAYFVARELDPVNLDLAQIAIVGNVGDMMARETLGLTGPAAEIVADGIEHGSVRLVRRDLNCYGTSTRPVHVCLSYNDDPRIPGITNDTRGALRFLERLGVALKTAGGRWRVWEELDPDEKRTITSALVQQLLANGESVDRLFAEAYLFPGEAERSPLRNASEFATLLNACGRWAKPGIGSSVCCGDRGTAYCEAEYVLNNHRAIIRELLQFILDTGVTELSHLQYLHVGDRYPDTIVGIGAGMALGKLNWRKPILVMCTLPEDPALTKVSMRTNEWSVRRGVDLQAVLAEATSELGGGGGGHPIAAGAFIPHDAEEVFVSRVNELLRDQLA
ncbi:MAG: DHH family phosphoesterase [Methanospirillum sp.]|nr:DHH family phosphoesterase [Methanospirillum sp.]